MNWIRLLLIVIAVGFSSAAYPCSCVRTTLNDDISKSEFIFIARIVSLDTLETPTELGGIVFPGEKLVGVRYSVTHQVKGNVENNGQIFTRALSAGNCSYDFKVGQRYMIYIKSDKFVSLCGATKHVSNISDEERRMIGDKPF
mgnify:CR=1 FL=1